MKKVLLGLVLIGTLSSCNSWVRKGYINPDNHCEYIVNDSISIIAKDCSYGEIEYNVYAKGRLVNVTPAYQWTRNSKNEIITTLKNRYEEYLRREKRLARKNRSNAFYSSKSAQCK